MADKATYAKKKEALEQRLKVLAEDKARVAKKTADTEATLRDVNAKLAAFEAEEKAAAEVA